MSIRHLSMLFILLTITPAEPASRRVATALPEYITTILISLIGLLASSRHCQTEPRISAAKHLERIIASHQITKDLIASTQTPPAITLTTEDINSACAVCYPHIHNKKGMTDIAVLHLAKKPLSIPELWAAVIATDWHIRTMIHPATEPATFTDDDNRKALQVSKYFMLALLTKYLLMQAEAEAFLKEPSPEVS